MFPSFPSPFQIISFFGVSAGSVCLQPQHLVFVFYSITNYQKRAFYTKYYKMVTSFEAKKFFLRRSKQQYNQASHDNLRHVPQPLFPSARSKTFCTAKNRRRNSSAPGFFIVSGQGGSFRVFCSPSPEK